VTDRTLLPLILIEQLGDASGRGALIGRTRLVKLVFLAQKEAPAAVVDLAGTAEPYAFWRHYYGPYSNRLLDDMHDLHRRGLIIEDSQALDAWGVVVQWQYSLTPEGRRVLDPFRTSDAYRTLWREVVRRYGFLKTQRLLQYVYTRYLQEPSPA